MDADVDADTHLGDREITVNLDVPPCPKGENIISVTGYPWFCYDGLIGQNKFVAI